MATSECVGLLRREREALARSSVNIKRVCRVMKPHGLLLGRRRKQPGVARRHEGRVAVAASWCSDGLEIRCDNGDKLRVTFAMDCREVMSWVAARRGIAVTMCRACAGQHREAYRSGAAGGRD